MHAGHNSRARQAAAAIALCMAAARRRRRRRRACCRMPRRLAAAMWLLPLLVRVAMSCGPLPSAGAWTRGMGSAVLTISTAGELHMTSGNDTVWRGTAVDSGCCGDDAPPSLEASLGMDWLGEYDQLRVGQCVVRYYSGLDAFLLQVQHGSRPTSFPNFTRTHPLAAAAAAAAMPLPPPGCQEANTGTDQVGGTVLRSNDSAAAWGYPNETNAGCCARCLENKQCDAWVIDRGVKGIANSTCFLVHGHRGSKPSPSRTVGFPRVPSPSPPPAATSQGGLAWEARYMLRGGRLQDWHGGSGIMTGRSDGPLFTYEQGTLASGTGAAIVLSPLDHFTTNQVQFQAASGAVDAMWMGSTAGPYPMLNESSTSPAPPPDTVTHSVLLGRSSLKRATMAWGAFARRFHNTTRQRGAGTTQLSYWDDNEAGYSFWQQSNDLDIWGPPENIYIALKKAYEAQAIPIRQFEIDPRGIHARHAMSGHGWCYIDWLSWNRTLFPQTAASPNGTAIKTAVLGNDSAVFYMSPFCNNTVHRQEFDFVSIGQWVGGPQPQPDLAETTPADTQAFYSSLLRVAKAFWGGQMLFIDFLCLRAPHLQHALPSHYEAGAEWLNAVGAAALQLQVEVQMCMACPHQAMQSLALPAITNARVNSDSGLMVPELIYSSTLAAAIGLGWSKDNLHLTGLSQGVVEQQVIFAALSLGPAGLADRLAGFPDPPKPGEAVTTNRSLAMSLCATNGQLLQPSFPLTVVDQQLGGLLLPLLGDDSSAGDDGNGGSTANSFVTYTAVDDFIAFVAVAFIYNRYEASSRPVSWILQPRHLTDIVDCEHFPPAPFEHVPWGGFRDATIHSSNASNVSNTSAAAPWACLGSETVAWYLGDTKATPFDWQGAGLPLSLSEHPTRVHISPVVNTSGLALLGEAGKVAMISTYRFASITVTEAGALRLALRGAPGEVVSLLVARRKLGFRVERIPLTIGAAGTHNLTLLQ